MTLVYRETGHFNGLSNPTGTQRWRLTYANRWNWTKELVANTGAPGDVGQAFHYAAGDLAIENDVTGQQLAPPAEQSAAAVVPDWWLVPLRQTVLEERGYLKTVDPDQPLTRYVTSVTVPCAPDTDGMATGVSQPATCATAATYSTRETITYRTDVVPPIPVEVVDEINGAVVSRIVVTELTIDMDGTRVQLIG